MKPVDRSTNQEAALNAHDHEEVIAALPVPMLIANDKGRIVALNALSKELLGPKADLGENLTNLIEGLGQPVSQWVTTTIAGIGNNRAEVLRVTDPEAERFVQVTMRRLPQQDGSVHVLLVLNDATDLKTLEAQFVQAQKMQAIGQLAGGIAHDFNNLLTAISGHCDLMLLRTAPEDEGYEDLVQINQNAHRAASLVGQLLAFSRKQTLLPENLDLSTTMQEAGVLLRRLVGARIKLLITVSRELPRISADKRQIEQMLMNLVVNARDAMPEGGTIQVSASPKRLDRPMRRNRVTVPKGDYVLVTVSDQGVGIPSNRLEKVFEPFYTTKRVGEGTGLGLSTVYGIVKQSGGYVFVDSEMGKGTTFSLYFRSLDALPDVKPEAPQREPEKAPEKPSKIRVLLAEDEEPVRAFAARALEIGGMEVSQAASGEEALDFLTEDCLPFDLYLSDVVMPGLDGPSWVRKALERYPGTPVVFMSGYTQEAFSDSQATISNSTFVAKPFSLADLNRAVQKQLAVNS